LDIFLIATKILRIIGDLPNTYAFTKSLAEDVIRREAQDLPILVFRPTVGTYTQLIIMLSGVPLL